MSVGLTIRGVKKRFGGTEVLLGVDLEVRPGEFFTLLGPSGCGKTTLLRCVAGFCRPDAGEVSCDGERLDPLPPHRRNLGVVFQNYALFPHMTVRENVAYGLRARKAAGALTGERVKRALEQVRLGHRADSFPGMLSGGEQQRVATARALAIEPRLLLMDEPLSNLDAKLRVQMRQEIKRVQRALGITTLYVTHDQEEALALSDRIAVMNAGRLEQVGAPTEIYRSPATPFVAGFIGHTNFLAGEVVSVAGGLARVRLGAAEPREQLVIEASVGGIGVGQSVTVAIRPERVRLGETGDGGGLRGEVEEVVFLGAITRVWVKTGTGQVQVEMHADEAMIPKAGDVVSIEFAAEGTMVFAQ